MVLFLVRVLKFSLTGFSLFRNCFSKIYAELLNNSKLDQSGTPNLSTRFLTFTGNALNFLYFGSKIRFQSHFISRGNNFHWTLKYDDAFRGGDLHICERSCALDVQTELHFWGIDDLHLEVDVLSSSDLSRNSYSWAILPQGLFPKQILQKSDKGQIFYWSSQTALGSGGCSLFDCHQLKNLKTISDLYNLTPKYFWPLLPNTSAQRVPEPDPIPGISFDTRPDPIQFWKSSGSG